MITASYERLKYAVTDAISCGVSISTVFDKEDHRTKSL